MTLIVGNFNKDTLCVDQFVVERDKKTACISQFKRKHESKIKFTKDGYFCYVFDFEQLETVKDLILNHIKAFEQGVLDPKFKLELPLKEDNADLTMYVVTRRGAYCVSSYECGKTVNITVMDGWYGNYKTMNNILEIIDFEVEDVFKTLRGTGRYLVGQMEVVHPSKKLKLIPKKKEGKKK